MSRLRLCFALLVLAAPGVRAQDADLGRAERLVAHGRYTEARDVVGRWLERARGSASDVSAGERARARLLRARLAPDLESAERHYLAVVLGYPSTPQAAEALLRLGQGLAAAGERERGVEYLRRLTVDHPESPRRETALRWLARIGSGPGGEGAGGDGDVAAASAASDGRAGTVAAVEPADRAPGPEADDAARYAVQTGAFRYERGAVELAERLRRAGFSPRFVFVPVNDLLRVRVGRFPALEDAVDLVRRLKAAGFAAVVVGDAADERAR